MAGPQVQVLLISFDRGSDRLGYAWRKRHYIPGNSVNACLQARQEVSSLRYTSVLYSPAEQGHHTCTYLIR